MDIIRTLAEELGIKYGQAQAAVRLKAEALQKIALQETSANGRHYYLACAKELLG